MLDKIKQSTDSYTEEDVIQEILAAYWTGSLRISFDTLIEDINNVALWNIVDESGDVWLTDY